MPKSVLQWLVLGLVLLYAGVILLAPLATLISYTFEDGVASILAALNDPSAQAALRLSVWVALVATTFNTLAGVAIAWVLVRHRFRGKRFWDALLNVPFVLSPVVVGMVILVLFGRNGWFSALKIAFSTEAILIVTVFVSLPFVAREVIPVLQSMTPEQEQAAYTLGAGRWMTFWRVVLPALRPAIIYGMVLTLARSLGEFGAAAVAGGGVQNSTETATIYIFRSLHDRQDINAYSMALLLGLIAILILLSMNALRDKHA